MGCWRWFSLYLGYSRQSESEKWPVLKKPTLTVSWRNKYQKAYVFILQVLILNKTIFDCPPKIKKFFLEKFFYNSEDNPISKRKRKIIYVEKLTLALLEVSHRFGWMQRKDAFGENIMFEFHTWIGNQCPTFFFNRMKIDLRVCNILVFHDENNRILLKLRKQELKMLKA